MTSKTPAAVAALLAALPADRRREMERVRNAVRKHMPAGYEEVVVKGNLIWQVPREVYPDTYNGQPLWYAALASRKAYLTLHLMNCYASPPLVEKVEAGFRAAGKKLNMGKACIRFKAASDLPLDVIGEVVASTPLDRWVEIAKAARRR
jgi:hypothetical protein